ncbi:DUF3108 domain-containing protein [uncultured Methylibium sp.]|uniref:DUF3108 domain-containing protein n=1 Tax=uncultured Methylibium sp. TaxID=381093 RepID=UPI0025DEE89B|nr:DUF3108 domain-containing protein [uncultured Methylibium sp.]
MTPRSPLAPAPLRRRAGLALLALAAVVALLHGWVIDGVARAAPPAAATRPPAAVMLAALRPETVAMTQTAAEPERSEPAAVEPPPVAPPRPRVAPRPLPALPPTETPAMPSDAAPTPAVPAEPAAPTPATLPAETEPPLILLAAAATAAPAAAGVPPPIYRTRIPAAAQVSYRLSRGALAGTGELDWRPEKGGYSLKLEGRLPLIGTLITQTSRGGFDAAGLAPERYTDRRLKRGEQAANFERASGRISFSGQNPELPLSPGVQDRLSVMLQLAAIVNAWSKPPAAGEHLRIEVVGARGDSHQWSLRFEGPQAIDTPDGRVAALRFLREPENPQDTRAEFWLDPARQHLPVKVVLTDGKGEPLELLRMK